MKKNLALIALVLALVPVLAFVDCGKGDGGPTTPSTTLPPVTTPPTTTLPPFAQLCGSPAPPPLYGLIVSVQNVAGNTRWVLDSRPQVVNEGAGTADSYCGKLGFDSRQRSCDTRPEGNLQREACDALVVGKARDTGRIGPTWTADDKPCISAGDPTGASGCINNPDNQFLITARGAGSYLACVADNIPIAEGGSRCGGCDLRGGDTRCPGR
jgi:hypothetical protein